MRRGRQDASFETRRPDTNAVNVVLCALPTTFSAALSAQAEKAGCRVVGRCTEDATELRATIDARTPQLLVTNLDVPGGLPLIETARAARAADLIIAAVTEIPSLVRVAEAVRRGASTVVARPATLGQILAATRSDCASLVPAPPDVARSRDLGVPESGADRSGLDLGGRPALAAGPNVVQTDAQKSSA